MSIYTAPYQESGSPLAYTVPGVSAFDGKSLMELYGNASAPASHYPCIHCRLVNGFRVLVRIFSRVLS